MPSKQVMAKYEAAKSALRRAGATLVEEEWPSEDGQNVLAKAFFQTKMGDEATCHCMYTFFCVTTSHSADFAALVSSCKQRVLLCHRGIQVFTTGVG